MSDKNGFYWLKLTKDFFNQKHIKSLLKSEKGYELSFCYLQLLLLSIDTDGTIRKENSQISLYQELSLSIDIKEETIKECLEILLGWGKVCFDEDSVSFVEVLERTGSKSASSDRVSNWRRRKQKEIQQSALQASQQAIVDDDNNTETSDDIEMLEAEEITEIAVDKTQPCINTQITDVKPVVAEDKEEEALVAVKETKIDRSDEVVSGYDTSEIAHSEMGTQIVSEVANFGAVENKTEIANVKAKQIKTKADTTAKVRRKKPSTSLCKVCEFSDEFEAFYKQYGAHARNSRKEAWEKWQQFIVDGTFPKNKDGSLNLGLLLRQADNYNKSLNPAENGKFKQGIQSWLNKHRWNDVFPEYKGDSLAEASTACYSSEFIRFVQAYEPTNNDALLDAWYAWSKCERTGVFPKNVDGSVNYDIIVEQANKYREISQGSPYKKTIKTWLDSWMWNTQYKTMSEKIDEVSFTSFVNKKRQETEMENNKALLKVVNGGNYNGQ